MVLNYLKKRKYLLKNNRFISLNTKEILSVSSLIHKKVLEFKKNIFTMFMKFSVLKKYFEKCKTHQGLNF